jgi:hypothetical protein
MAFYAGQRLTAGTLNLASRSNQQTSTLTTTSTSYGAGTGTTCGIDFVAPPSGKVTILFGTAGFNSGANDNKTSVRVGTDATVGAGTQVYAANDNDMILFTGSVTYRITSFAEVTGLTAGNTYNVQMQHRVSAGTGSFPFRWVKVIPDLA